MPGLLGFERRWLHAVFEAILPSGAHPTLTLGARDVPMDAFIDDLWAHAPLQLLELFLRQLGVGELGDHDLIGDERHHVDAKHPSGMALVKRAYALAVTRQRVRGDLVEVASVAGQ